MTRGRLAELNARAVLDARAPGELLAAAPFPQLLRFFDSSLRDLALRGQAREHHYATSLSAPRLRKLGFFESFPHYATWLGAADEARGEVLSPAVCYHLYDLLEGERLEENNLVVTARGSCFRAEGSRHASRDGRLRSFSMREIIVVGDARSVAGRIRRFVAAAGRVLASAGLETRLAASSDSFFLGEARGRKLLQKIAGLKSEFTVDLPAADPLAVGSVNHHRDFFGLRMKITLPDGAIAESACLAFGLERLALAFIARHGLDRGAWPARVARSVQRDGAR
jgi:seryl-tRNA synthetase